MKLLLTLAFILALGLSPAGAWPAYILFAALLFSMEVISGVPVRFYLSRSMLAVGFALAALPLIFQPGGRSIAIIEIAGISLTVFIAGLERFLSIVLKSWLSMQAALVLAATTAFPYLLAAMRQLGMPRVLVSIMSLMWRYLFLLRDEALRLLAARASRSATPEGRIHHPPLVWRAKVTGGMVGNLLLRSIARSERVYASMVARGYSGDPPAVNAVRLDKQDRACLVAGIAILVGVWFLSLLFGG